MDKKNLELESIFTGSIFAQPFRSICWSQYWVVPPVEFQAALESRHVTSHGNMGKTKTLILKRWNTYFEGNGNLEQRLKKNDSECRITEGHFHPGLENKSDLFPEIR